MHQRVLVAASAGEHPLIDLDYTIFVQLVIFLVVAFVASRLVFRPFLRMKEEREAGIEGARDEATRLRTEAETRLADYEAELAAARARAEGERRKLRAEAAAYEREVTDAARTETQAAMSEATQTLEAQTQRARDELAPKVDQIATVIATKLLGREVPS